MKRTYDEILNSMKNAYFTECGNAVEDDSQTMKRFEILSSELFSVSCYGDYIFKQAFVQTASGENLDKLGELRGCTRKTASKASGALTFSISQPGEKDIVIPENTVCSLEGKPYVQFATDERTVIAAGQQSVMVSATALGNGEEYNAPANTVTVMVNAPVSVEAVTNANAFDGGYSDERDTAYRARILRHYAILPNGINCTSYENRVLTLDYIIDCKIVPATPDSCMIICVATKNGSITDEQRAEVVDIISVIDAAAVSYELKTAEKQTVSLKADIRIMTGFAENEIIRQMHNEIREVFSAARIGEVVFVSSLKKAISEIDGLLDCSFYADDMIEDVICPEACAILQLSNLEVCCSYD